MRRTACGRASSVALAAFLGVLVGAALVWALVRGGPAPVIAPRGAPATSLPAGDARPAGVVRPAVSGASQDAITAAVEKVGPAVVNISVLFQPSRQDLMARAFGFEPFPRAGQGSGVIIDGKNGYIITNAHVVKGAQRVMVTMANGKRLEAKVVGIDPLTEVAVVKVPGDDYTQAVLGSAQNLPIGSWVIAIGNPFGFENSVTVGVLSARGRQIGAPGGASLQDLLQTDASINPGNSGGALVDLNGNLIGMPTAVIPYAQGIGFAVSIDVAKQVADKLIKTGKMPWIGIQHTTLPAEEAKRLRLPTGPGTTVVGVIPNGPAATAGIEPGDLITRLGDQPIQSERDLTQAIRAHNAGDRVEITLTRNGKEMRVAVTLGAVPPNLGGR